MPLAVSRGSGSSSALQPSENQYNTIYTAGGSFFENRASRQAGTVWSSVDVSRAVPHAGRSRENLMAFGINVRAHIFVIVSLSNIYESYRITMDVHK